MEAKGSMGEAVRLLEFHGDVVYNEGPKNEPAVIRTRAKVYVRRMKRFHGLLGQEGC